MDPIAYRLWLYPRLQDLGLLGGCFKGIKTVHNFEDVQHGKKQLQHQSAVFQNIPYVTYPCISHKQKKLNMNELWDAHSQKAGKTP